MIWNLNPVALKIGPLQVRWYGIFYVIDFFIVQYLGWYFFQKNNPKIKKFSEKNWEDICFYTFIFGIIGGRFGEFLFYSPSTFWTDPLQVLKIWEGGMSIHGGFLGAIAALFFLAKRYNISATKIFDAMAIPMSLALGIGRIANYINGEIVGIPTEKSWGVVFPHIDTLLRHPVQLYESFAMFLLALGLYLVWKLNKNFEGKTMSLFLIGYGIFRLIVEIWKESPGFIGDYKTGQVLSLGMVFIGLYWFFIARKNAQ